MTQAEKNRMERPLDEWAIHTAQKEIQSRNYRRRADRQEKRKKLEERNEALRDMLNRK